MDGKTFWKQVDDQLKTQGLTITELATLIGQSRSTLFVQRNRLTVPKANQIRKMEDVLGIRFFEEEDSCMEYLPYLRKAEEWQLKSVRQILNMPESSWEGDGSSLSKAN